MIKIIQFDDSCVRYLNSKSINDVDLNDLDGFIPSTCCIDNKDIIDTNIRKSYVHENSHNFIIDGLIEIGREIGIPFNSMFVRGWKLLKYEPGCKFDTHIDSTGKYTLLLFPSNKINDIEGGELVIIENGEERVFAPNLFYKTTLIIMESNLPHRVNEVIKGNRYVFKLSSDLNTNTNSSKQGNVFDSSFHKRRQPRQRCNIL